MKLVYGRCDYFSAIEHGQLQPAAILSHEESVRQEHLILTLKARNAVISLDADATVARCLQKNVRAGQTAAPVIGSAVNVAMAGRSHAGWRLIGRIHSNVIVEQDGLIEKIAATAIRPIEWPIGRLPNTDELGPLGMILMRMAEKS